MTRIISVDARGTLTSDLWSDTGRNSYISIDDKVLLVGPGVMDEDCSQSLPMDTSMVFLLTYLSGEFTIFDLPVDDVRGGLHNWRAVAKQVDSWRSQGARFCNYEFVEGSIKNSKLSAGYDVIIDHDTYRWVNPPTSA